MKHLYTGALLCALALTLFATTANAQSERSPKSASTHVAEALDAVRDAMDEGLDADRRCRRLTVDDLRALRDDLKRWRPELKAARRGRHKQLRRVRRELEALADDSAGVCPRDMTRLLRASTDHLEAISHSRHEPIEPKRAAYTCWDPTDAACDTTRDGARPMDKASFERLQREMRAELPHAFSVQKVAMRTLEREYVTAKQLSALLEFMKPHVFIMKDVVVVAAPRLIDPERGQSVTCMFQPHDSIARDVARLIAAQKPNRKKARKARRYNYQRASRVRTPQQLVRWR